MNTERAKELIEIIDNAKSELLAIFAGSKSQPAIGTVVTSPPKAATTQLHKVPKSIAGPKAEKKTRNMTPEGRAAISAAAKRRWAAFKKAKKATKLD